MSSSSRPLGFRGGAGVDARQEFRDAATGQPGAVELLEEADPADGWSV
jgi:hypothetical protein